MGSSIWSICCWFFVSVVIPVSIVVEIGGYLIPMVSLFVHILACVVFPSVGFFGRFFSVVRMERTDRFWP